MTIQIRADPTHGGEACPEFKERPCNTNTCPTKPTGWTTELETTTTAMPPTTTILTPPITTPEFPLKDVEKTIATFLQTLGCTFILSALGVTIGIFLILRLGYVILEDYLE